MRTAEQHVRLALADHIHINKLDEDEVEELIQSHIEYSRNQTRQALIEMSHNLNKNKQEDEDD